MNSKFTLPLYTLLVLFFILSDQQMLIAQGHHHHSSIVKPPAHGHNHSVEQKIYFPDLPNTKTISCDFHMHTVFQMVPYGPIFVFLRRLEKVLIVFQLQSI